MARRAPSRRLRSPQVVAASVACATALAALCCHLAPPGRTYVPSVHAAYDEPIEDALHSRRTLVAALAAQAAFPATAAFAGDRDRASMVLNARNKYLKRIIEGHEELKAAGTISDEFLETKLKKFVSALDLYGSIQRQQEAPDKVSKKLQADAKEINKLAKARDFEQVMAALENYRQDIPAGPGEFQWTTVGQYSS